MCFNDLNFKTILSVSVKRLFFLWDTEVSSESIGESDKMDEAIKLYKSTLPPVMINSTSSAAF